jgi:hypothetical protein
MASSLSRPSVRMQMPNSLVRGTIYIYSNNKHKWEKRWFVLDNDLLFYYKNVSVRPRSALPSSGGRWHMADGRLASCVRARRRERQRM